MNKNLFHLEKNLCLIFSEDSTYAQDSNVCSGQVTRGLNKSTSCSTGCEEMLSELIELCPPVRRRNDLQKKK